MDNLKFLYTEKGNILISILLGFSLSSILFRFKCKTNCVVYKLHPDFNENSGKIYYDNKYYRYKKKYV
jgi:hypothetical protein